MRLYELVFAVLFGCLVSWRISHQNEEIAQLKRRIDSMSLYNAQLCKDGLNKMTVALDRCMSVNSDFESVIRGQLGLDGRDCAFDQKGQ